MSVHTDLESHLGLQALTSCHNLFVSTVLVKIALRLAEATARMCAKELSAERMMNQTFLKCFGR